MFPEPSLGTQLHIHPGQLARRSSRDAAPSISDAQSAALRGASLAFSKTPNPPTFNVNAYSGTNGALAAAVTAGSNTKQYRNENNKLVQVAGEGRENTNPLTAAQRSMARENMRKDIDSATSSKVLGEKFSSVRSSPSNIAAILASGKDSRGRQQARATVQEIRPPVPREDHSLQDGQKHAKITPANSVVETNHVAPTASLIQFFERSGTEHDQTHNSAPNYTVSSPAILSPKPVRPLSLIDTPLAGALAAAQTLSSRRGSSHDRTVSIKRDLGHQASESASPSLDALIDRTRSQQVKPTTPSTTMPSHRKRTPSSPSAPKAQNVAKTNDSSAFNRASSVHGQKPELRRATSSVPSVNTASRPSISSSREESLSNIKLPYQSPSAGSIRTNGHHSLNMNERRLLPTRRSMTSLMTESSLADAIVASSLASSRAPSPSKLSTTPLPRRRSRSRHMFQHHRHNPQLDSRTPSPPKTMRHTMRKDHNSDEEDDDPISSRRRKRSNFLNKHPNKHHEGARKRWRDVVTERERKRYEGVWAANKGIYVSVESLPVPKILQPREPFSLAAESVVLNLVVRDIWSRSRLGNEVLEEIWDLVDRKGLGLLDREEFVVGMWLIDQRLKGRKLPVKVSASVWDSVRAIGGIKIPKRKS